MRDFAFEEKVFDGSALSVFKESFVLEDVFNFAFVFFFNRPSDVVDLRQKYFVQLCSGVGFQDVHPLESGLESLVEVEEAAFNVLFVPGNDAYEFACIFREKSAERVHGFFREGIFSFLS